MSTCIMNLQKRCVSFDVSESICIESVIARALDILTSDGAQLKKGERERERALSAAQRSAPVKTRLLQPEL